MKSVYSAFTNNATSLRTLSLLIRLNLCRIFASGKKVFQIFLNISTITTFFYCVKHCVESTEFHCPYFYYEILASLDFNEFSKKENAQFFLMTLQALFSFPHTASTSASVSMRQQPVFKRRFLKSEDKKTLSSFSRAT